MQAVVGIHVVSHTLDYAARGGYSCGESYPGLCRQ